MDATARDHLDALRRLLDRERDEARARHEAVVRERGLPAFAEAGLALTGLVAQDEGGGLGGRHLVRFGPGRAGQALAESTIGPGSVVRLVSSRDPDSLEGGPVGLVYRRSGDAVVVAFDEPPPEEATSGGGLALVEMPDEVTWRRETEVLRAVKGARLGRLADLRDLFVGAERARPKWDPAPRAPLAVLDAGLDASQRDAVAFALGARDVALVHGPPGTGKTTALVELVRQAVRRGETVLACAPSNTAVDNLAERLLGAGERVVRVGHPARVSPALHGATLDLRVQETEPYRLSRRLLEEARKLIDRRRRLTARVDRGRVRAFEIRDERRELGREIGRLMADVRRMESQAVASVLEGADVVCATLTGAASDLLGRQAWDLVVVDEATQATEPATWLAVQRAGEAGRVVLAGDHHQLPPTVVSPDAARDGLSVSLFERLVDRFGDDVRRLLTVQYRMHETLMAFPSRRFYEGRLTAAPAVAGHLLQDLEGVAAGPDTEAPLCFIDTAGRGFDEVRPEGDESTANDGEAALAATRVRALLAAGVAPEAVAVISPYAAQVRRLRDLLADVPGLEIGTVDGFQGREKEAVVVSLVRSNERGEVGFLADVRRMNVAWTRARRRLEVVGDGATLAAHPFYEALIAYAEAQGAWRSAWELA